MPWDEDLIERLKRGEPAAFGVLVEQFEGPLYRFFLCGRRDHHAAQEQTAETLAQLVRTLPGLRGGAGQLRAYVFSTARHVQLRSWRKKRVRTVPLEDAGEVCAPGGRGTPAQQVDIQEQARRVLDVMSGLEEPLRQVLLLRFVEGCTIEEVAQALDMPAGTVKSHISRGRERLKTLLVDQTQGCRT